MNDEHADLIEKLEKAPKFDESLSGELKAAIAGFKEDYVKDNANVLAA